MNGIIQPRTTLQRGCILQASGVITRSGIITKGDWKDPLSDVPMVLRLQAHAEETEGVLYDVEVSGAGQSEVNGLYRYNGLYDGRPSFQHTTVNSRLMWFSGWQPIPVWLLNGPESPSYISLTNTPLPPDEGWIDVGGGGSAPTFTLIPHARRKPLGLYKDMACSMPATEHGDAVAAWRDELSGSGVVAVQPDFTKRPALKFEEGVPVVAFDGVDDFLRIDVTGPVRTLAVSAFVPDDGSSNHSGLICARDGNFSHKVPQSDTSMVIARTNTGQRTIYGDIATTKVRTNSSPGDTGHFTDFNTGIPLSPAWHQITIEAEDSPSGAKYFTLGSDPYSPSRCLAARVVGVTMHNQTISGAQRFKLENYLRKLQPGYGSIDGVDFILRLQTHRGDCIPLGLYTDMACSTPATEHGDAIAAWRDELSGSGVVAVQSDPERRPLLRFREGVPTIEFDGVNDYLSIPANIIGHSGDQTIGAAFTIDDFESYGGVITSKVIFTDSAPSIEIEPPGALIAGTFAATPYKALHFWSGPASTHRKCSAVLIRTGTTGEFFIDGVSVGSATGITGEGEYSPQTYIGTSRVQEFNYFDGDITAILVTRRTDVAVPMAHYLQSIHPS